MKWIGLLLSIFAVIVHDPAYAAGLEPLKLTFWASPRDATDSTPEEFDVYSPHDFAPDFFEVRVSLLNTGDADVNAASVFISINPVISVLAPLDEDGNVDTFRTRAAGVTFPSMAVGTTSVRNMVADGLVETAYVRDLPLGHWLRHLNTQSPGYCYISEVEVSAFVLPRTGMVDLGRCVIKRRIPFKFLD